jgi:3-hydroxyisobutyrate dehydrogenase-like beta-hydroxyacid dehydrogenase
MADEIGFIGLGSMGGAMAMRLADKGHRLVIYDPEVKSRQPLVDRGAKAAESARAVADRAAVVIACLPTVEISKTVALGNEGIIHGEAVRCYIETSTIGRQAIEEIGTGLGPSGIEVVDAPVSGGPRAARAGTLSIMTSGSANALSRARPVLEAISESLFNVGTTAGLAQLCKLVNNALSLTGMALACEAIVVGAKGGLDPTIMLSAINASSGRNSATYDKFPNAVLTRTFDYGGPLSLASKDLHLFLEEAARQAVPTSVTSAGAAMWDAARQEGDPNRDFTTLIQIVERMANFEVDGRISTAAAQ